jgi:DNA mismatch repair protein MutS
VFATHYHELTQLADELDALRNYNVAVREAGEQILFLHRLQPGGADRSYGIEVGRLAGLPGQVIERARQILALLEGEQLSRGAQLGVADRTRGKGARVPPADQLGLFAAMPNPVLERLASLDVDTMTPIEALTTLARLADEAKRSQ